MASRISGHIAMGIACPIRGIVTSFAPGIAAAVALPAARRTGGSASPWMTSAGTFTVARRAVQSPDAKMARSGWHREGAADARGEVRDDTQQLRL